MHSVVLGSIVGILIGLVTEYYTGIEPVFGIKTKAIPHIGEMSKTGPATNANRWTVSRNDVHFYPNCA